SLSSPMGDVRGTVESYSKAPNKARSFITIDLKALGAPDDMTIDQRFDGTAGWVLNSMQGDTPMSTSQVQGMRNNEFPTPLLHYKEASAKIDVLPREQIGGKDAVVLRITPKMGPAVKICFDPETSLLIRTVVTLNMPQAGGDIEQTSD